jgi:phenylpropionate dioxygenase-like ring-hydroxylating dioxygenase large terminal subunit
LSLPAGWTFNGTGACTSIPQALPGAVGHESPRACVESYPCVLRQGLLWVKPTAEARLIAEEGSIREDDLPLVGEVDKEDGWVMGTVTRWALYLVRD